MNKAPEARLSRDPHWVWLAQGHLPLLVVPCPEVKVFPGWNLVTLFSLYGDSWVDGTQMDLPVPHKKGSAASGEGLKLGRRRPPSSSQSMGLPLIFWVTCPVSLFARRE